MSLIKQISINVGVLFVYDKVLGHSRVCGLCSIRQVELD